MEIRIGTPPIDAITVENTIRNHCQHYGYPEAKIMLNPLGELVLKLNDVSPLPGTTSMESLRTSPKC